MNDLSAKRELHDLSAKRELHDQAKELLDNKAFTDAILALRRRWFAELMDAAETTERKLELVAMIKALEALPAELKVLINDYTMARRHERHA